MKKIIAILLILCIVLSLFLFYLLTIEIKAYGFVGKSLSEIESRAEVSISVSDILKRNIRNITGSNYLSTSSLIFNCDSFDFVTINWD